MSTVTAVIPVYNEARWIGDTLRRLDAAAARAPGLDVDVVVVDDGSEDGTPAATREAEVAIPVRVVSQANAGRFAARARGLEEAGGDLILFLDSRVAVAPDSLAFVAERLRADPGDSVWNAHVVIDSKGNPYGRFWDVLTEIAWSEYFDDPRTTYFDASNFDNYPKGTTCFLAPRELILGSFGGHRSYYADRKFANDDTPMIRQIAEQRPIGVSPHFSCIYRPRESFVPFVRHAYHRGTVFLDGHGRRGARLLPAVIGFYPVSAGIALASTRRPLVGIASLAAVAAGATAVATLKRRSAAETAAFASLAPVYAVAHGLGMWRGLLLAARVRAT
jgi:glycosyltransferase involved in cell wall biosynthesis